MLSYRFVIPGLWNGGGPRNVYTLSGCLRKKGYDSSLLVFTDLTKVPAVIGGRSTTPNLADARVRFLVSPVGLINQTLWKVSQKSSLFIPHQLIASTLSLMAVAEPTCYIASAWQTVFPVFRVAQLVRKPALYFVQAYEPTFALRRIHEYFANRTYLYPIVRFSQSAWLARFLDSNCAGKTYYLGMGINHHDFCPPKNLEYKRRIVTVARWDVNKGFNIFVQAIKHLRKIRNDFEVVIIGEKQALDMQNIDFPYKFAGWISKDSELASYYQGSIFVNTGIHEALPMPPIEAMACGATVVMTDMEGAKEYTIDHENCLLAPIGNARSVANCLSEALSSDQLREKLSTNAILTANRYTWEAVTTNFENMVKNEGIA